MAKRKAGRMECYVVLAGRPRDPETGVKKAAVKLGFVFARSPEDAVARLTAGKTFPEGTGFSAYLGDAASEREWAAEARIA